MSVAAVAPVVTAAAKRAAARKARPRASEVYPLPKPRPAATPTPTPAAGPASSSPPAAPADEGGFFSGLRQGAGEAYAGRDRSRFSGVGSGMLLGLLVYPVVLAYLRGGTPRAKGWLRAKFLNETMPAPATPGSSGGSGAAGSGAAGSGSAGSSSGSW